MAFIENIYSAKEIKEKFEILDKNENNDPLIASENLKQLETILGISVNEEQSVPKDPMRETKNTFLRNQKQAEEFVSKLQKEKKDKERHIREIEKRESEKYAISEPRLV